MKLAASLLCAFSTVAAQCPSDHLGGGTHRRTIASGGRQRDYTLVVPSSYNNSEPLRLVITIHGYTQTASSIERITGISGYVNSENFVVAYPQGVGNSWNAGTCCGDAQREGVADYDFIGIDLMDDVKNNLCIDNNKIYVTGFSNGCSMMHGLLCIFPDVFKAGSCNGGCMSLTENCCDRYFQEAPSRRASVMEMHGTLDSLVPIGGSSWCPSIQSTNDAWADRLGCSDESFTWYEAGRYRCTRRNECTDGEILEQCIATGGGHTWYSDWLFDQTTAVLQFFGILDYSHVPPGRAFKSEDDVSPEEIERAMASHKVAVEEQSKYVQAHPESKGVCPHSRAKDSPA